MRKCQLNSPRTTLLQLIIVAVSLFGNTSGSKGRFDDAEPDYDWIYEGETARANA